MKCSGSQRWDNSIEVTLLYKTRTGTWCSKAFSATSFRGNRYEWDTNDEVFFVCMSFECSSKSYGMESSFTIDKKRIKRNNVLSVQYKENSYVGFPVQQSNSQKLCAIKSATCLIHPVLKFEICSCNSRQHISFVHHPGSTQHKASNLITWPEDFTAQLHARSH